MSVTRPILALCGLLFGASFALCTEPVRQPNGPGKAPPELRAGYLERLKEQKASIPASLPKLVQRELAKLYEDRTNAFLELLDNDLLLFDHPINAEVERIVAVLLEPLPADERDIRVFVLRDETPNAFSIGNGTIMFTLGMLERVQNEAQIAFILAHEVAHERLRHAETDMLNYAQSIHDKEFQKQLMSAYRSTYNKVEKLQELLIGFSLDKRRHGRTHEYEADSTGLDLLQRTNYQLSAAVTTMDVLLACDKEYFSNTLDLHNAFSRTGDAFNSDWILRRGPSLGLSDRERGALDDSLKTHPDCELRREVLGSQVANLGGDRGVAAIMEAERFERLQLMARMEVIDLYLYQGNPARAMYLSLRLLEDEPENAYARAVVGIALGSLHHYQTNRVVGKVLEQPHHTYSDSYNLISRMLGELRLKDLAALGLAWMAEDRANGTDDPELLLALAITSKATGSTDETKEYADRYRELFPEGRHIDRLKRWVDAPVTNK